mgnify:FL=1
MARSVQEITEYLKTKFVEDSTLQQVYDLEEGKTFDEQFSKVSIEARLIDAFAWTSWGLESIWDTFRTEVETVLNDSYVTGERWYYQKALEFQKGDKLAYNERTCRFDYAQVDEEKKVVKNVAIRQVIDEGVTKLKIYFSNAGKQPITGDIRTAFESYMREIGAAGTHFLFVSETPDELRVHLHVYYDPLVLNSAGERIEGSGKPVEETIEAYLNALEYGGVFYSSKLVDMIQTTEGVKDVTLDETTWDGEKEYRRRIDANSGAFAYVKQDGDIIYSIE